MLRTRSTSNDTSVKPGSPTPGNGGDSGLLSALLRQLGAGNGGVPQKKSLKVKVGHSSKSRQLAWYDPCEASALDMMLRTACGVPAGSQYLLLDASTMEAVAVSSSLPSEHTFELVSASRRRTARTLLRTSHPLFSLLQVILPSPSPGVGPAAPTSAMVVVDPISTGIVLCHQAVHQRGLAVIAVWSDVMPDELKGFVDPRYGIEFAAKITHRTGGLADTVAAVRAVDLEIVECVVGCETGVLLNDELAEALGARGNGTNKSSLRRNKFLQTEAVRNAGLNACGQMLADTHDDLEKFLREKPKAATFKAVVKPVEGAGSDGVFICDSPDEVRNAYASLEGTKNVLGLTNYSVLLQVTALTGHAAT